MKVLTGFKGHFLIVCLAIIIMSSMFAGCKKNDNTEPRPTAIVEAEVPTEAPVDDPQEEEMTAEEAADDTVAIANELADITSLINEELYHDALMSVNALLTKNLTDEQKNKVMELKAIIDAKLGLGQ